MRLLRRFVRLQGGQRWLLCQSVFLLAAIRIGLRVLPFARLRTLLAWLAATGREPQPPAGTAAADETIWAVEAAARRFPSIGTCLTKALATQVLLARAGYRSSLRIGVTRNGEGRFIAHAWLEKDGEIVMGGAGHAGYVPMPALNGLEP